MKEEIKEENNTLHRTTLRILEILKLVADNPGRFTLSDVSDRLRISKSTISPILHTLVHKGFLSLGTDLRYRIGFSAYEIGTCFLHQFSFLDEIEKILSDVTNVCMEASHFAVLSGGDVLYLKKVNSPEPIRMVSYVGNRIPAYSTALGKALLLNMSINDIRKLYPDGLLPVTEHTITDFNELKEQLLKARQEGFVYESEESNQYIRCIAVPIRKAEKIVAAVSVATPVFRYDEKKEALIKTLLSNAQYKIETFISRLEINYEDLIQ